MPAFSLTPVGTFPPPTGEFPENIQWQQDGVNLGDRAVDTVNLTGSLVGSRGTGETANVLTLADGSNPSAAPGSSVPILVVSLVGATAGEFANADFSDWTGTVLATSTQASWNEATSQIEIDETGLYRIDIASRVTATGGSWPTGNEDWSLFGSTVAEALVLTRSRHARFAPGGGDAGVDPAMQWTDSFVVNATGLPQAITPALYALKYDGAGVGCTFDALVFVIRISDPWVD
jgi:hypothetical protein